MITSLFVLIRILANPISNVFQKMLTQESASPVFIVCVTHVLLSLASLPALLYLYPLEIAEPFWISMLIAAVLAVAGNIFLVHAIRTTDLSILGPINAYKSVVSLIFGVFLIHEIPTLMGVAGVLLILAGSYFVVDKDLTQPRRNAFVQFYKDRGVRFRLAALVLSAVEAIFLKRALLSSSPLTTFVFWSIFGVPIAATAVAYLLRGSVRGEVVTLGRNKWTYLRLAITTGLMQLATLCTFGKLQVGYSLALFQTSTIISVFLGYRYFQEANILKRLCGSLVMIVGAILIVVFGAQR